MSGSTTAVSFLLCLAFIGFGSIFVQGAAAQQDDEEFFDLGITEYEISCMSCHGVDGRGDGPDARHLETKPTDLTQLAKTHGGVFPSERVAMFIDGRVIVATHGPREMPIWGDRYRLPVPEEEDWDTEGDARSRIAALVTFVESLQER